MEEYSEIIKHIVFFAIFVCLITLIIALVLELYLKKFNFSPKKSRVYGILAGLDNKSVWAFGLVTLNYLFLTFCAMTTTSMNPLYISIILLPGIISCILTKDYIKLPFNIMTSLVNIFALYIVNFIHIYLDNGVGEIYMRIAIFFIIAFVYIYFTYNYLNDVNDIVVKNKHIARKRKQVKA